MVVAAPDRPGIDVTKVPWQDGPDGFVFHGMGAPYHVVREWEDGLYLAVSAGRWSGKSAAGATRHFLYVNAWPGSTNIIAVPDFGDFTRSTFPALQKVLTANGLRHGEHYEYNVTNHILTYKWNDSRAYVISLDDPEDVRGPDAASAWVDEAQGTVEKAFLNLTPTLRQPGYPHQLWITMTPPDQFHWSFWAFEPERAFAEGFTDRRPIVEGQRWDNIPGTESGSGYEYFLPDTEDGPGGHFRVVYAFSGDNPYVSKSTLETNLYIAGGRNSQLAQREFYGQWTTLEGLVFPTFDPRKHIVPRGEWPTKPTRYVVGFDYGFGTYSAFIVIGIDDEGRIYLVEEFYRPHMDELTIRNIGRHLMKKYDISMFFADSAAPAAISALKGGGLPCWGADKRGAKSMSDPGIGLGLVNWAITSRIKDGSQRLYVDPSLKNFRAEMGSYIWETPGKNKEPGERPRKKNDHLVDSLRYGLMGLTNRLRWLHIAREATTWDYGIKVA